MARQQMSESVLKYSVRRSLDHLDEMRQVIHASGLVLFKVDECCDDDVHLNLAMNHGLALMQCAERMQQETDEIEKWVFGDSQDKGGHDESSNS